MYRILVADDHAIVRRGIREILHGSFPAAEVETVNNAEELMQKVIKKDWSLVIVDISMPGRSGLDVLSDMTKQFPQIPVLVLSMHSEEEYGIRVIKAGGAGYLCKDDAVEEQLVKAVDLILQGRKYITPTLAERLALRISGNAVQQPHEALSDREFEVFILLAQGKPTGRIADQLSLSVNTVGSFRRRILEKMRMKSNAEIVAYAIKNNLLI